MTRTRRFALSSAHTRGHRSRLRIEALEDRRLLSVVPEGPEFLVDSYAPSAESGTSVASNGLGQVGADSGTYAEGSFVAPPPGAWLAQGPAPTENAQVNVPPNDEASGAIQVIAPHPSTADILYIGAVNGGIWKTTNATAASPT